MRIGCITLPCNGLREFFRFVAIYESSRVFSLYQGCVIIGSFRVTGIGTKRIDFQVLTVQGLLRLESDQVSEGRLMINAFTKALFELAQQPSRLLLNA